MNTNEKIGMFMKHLEDIGIAKITGHSIEIQADGLYFGTATNEETDEKGIYFVMNSEICKIAMTHVISDKKVLYNLKLAIDKILNEDNQVEVV